MIAGVLGAAGRKPVHNRAGSNMTWGVATALLEQRGSEGLFEVDEAWLPRVAADLGPKLIVLGNLFRDQLDRYGELERLADDWAEVVAAHAGGTEFVLNADDPLVADLGRDRELRRRDGVTFFGIEDPSPGAARAPARPRRQALPPLWRAVRVRARLRRTPRPLHVPELRRRPPGARRRGDADRARRDLRLARRGPHPAGRARASPSPSPASTTSTTRSARSPRRCGSASISSGSARASRRCGPSSGASRRSKSARPRSRSC